MEKMRNSLREVYAIHKEEIEELIDVIMEESESGRYAEFSFSAKTGVFVVNLHNENGIIYDTETIDLDSDLASIDIKVAMNKLIRL